MWLEGYEKVKWVISMCFSFYEFQATQWIYTYIRNYLFYTKWGWQHFLNIPLSSFLPWVLGPSVLNQSSIFLVYIYIWVGNILKSEFSEMILSVVFSVVELKLSTKSSFPFTTSCWFILFIFPFQFLDPKLVASGTCLVLAFCHRIPFIGHITQMKGYLPGNEIFNYEANWDGDWLSPSF